MAERTYRSDTPSQFDPPCPGIACRLGRHYQATRALHCRHRTELQYRLKAAEWTLRQMAQHDRHWADRAYELIWYHRCYVLLHQMGD